MVVYLLFRKYDMDAKKGSNMKIYEGYGLSLHKKEKNYYIRYIAGEIVYKYQNQCYVETGSYWRKSDFLSPEEMRREGYLVSEGTQPLV